MEVIRFTEILIFLLFSMFQVFTSLFSLYFLGNVIGLEISFNFSNFVLFSVFFWLYLFMFYNIFTRLYPMPKGVIHKNTRAEKIYNLYVLFSLIYMNPLIFSNICPVPFRRKLYQIFGAKIGFNTYPSGIILDPYFVELGDFTIVGFNSLICPHTLVTGLLSHEPIKIGSRVTISVGVTIYGGTTIEDGARVLAHAVVNPNTFISSGEVWGGIPAKCIQKN